MEDPRYSAHLEVEDYDDDFMLWQGGTTVDEGTSSDPVHGRTPGTALLGLLNSLAVTDYNCRFGPADPVPKGYRYVQFVREWLDELIQACKSGRLPDEYDLRLSGNWEVQIVVRDHQSQPARKPQRLTVGDLRSILTNSGLPDTARVEVTYDGYVPETVERAEYACMDGLSDPFLRIILELGNR